MKSSKTKLPALEIQSPGLLATLQDRGRVGWRRFGVPASGVMDDHAAAVANQLVGNKEGAPVLELLLQGARLIARGEMTVAVTGADANATIPTWQACKLRSDEMVAFPQNHSGVWIYVAVRGGWMAPRILGSTSVYPRGGIGRAMATGDRLMPGTAVHGGVAIEVTRRDYRSPPAFRVWPGPQWDSFSTEARAAFFSRAWTVTSQSDRVGYRFGGDPLPPTGAQLPSEPVLPGTIQVPDNGLPIVTMRDGPTVGGYPKLGVLDPQDLSWLVQCRPGQKVRFQPV